MKKRNLVLFIAACLFITSEDVGQAQENNYPMIKNQGETQESIAEISSRLDDLNDEIKDIRQTETELELKLKNTNSALKEKNQKKEELQEDKKSLLVEIKKLSEDYTNSIKQSNERYEILKKRLIILQDRNLTNEYISILLDATSPSEFIDRFNAILLFIEADQQTLQEIMNEQSRIRKKDTRLKKYLLQLTEIDNALSIQLNEIEQDKEQQTLLLSQIRDRQLKAVQEKELLEARNEELIKQDQLRSKQLASAVSTKMLPSTFNYQKGVPEEYIPYYVSSGEKYGVDWYVLSAIHSVETAYSTHPTMISSAGAVGHMQFLPLTWIGYKYDNGNGKPESNVDITDLNIIKLGNGYGSDGDGDGKADPFNVADAIESAAKYLSKNGYATNPAKAIWHYNHAQWYVDKVLLEAKRIEELNKL